MLYQASILEPYNIVDKILDNDLRFMLVKKDSPDLQFIDLFRQRLTYDQAVMFINENNVSIGAYIYHLGYNYQFDNVEYALERSQASKILFAHWRILGNNKTRAKSQYTCKKFREFMESIQFYDADYLIVQQF